MDNWGQSFNLDHRIELLNTPEQFQSFSSTSANTELESQTATNTHEQSEPESPVEISVEAIPDLEWSWRPYLQEDDVLRPWKVGTTYHMLSDNLVHDDMIPISKMDIKMFEDMVFVHARHGAGDGRRVSGERDTTFKPEERIVRSNQAPARKFRRCLARAIERTREEAFFFSYCTAMVNFSLREDMFGLYDAVLFKFSRKGNNTQQEGEGILEGDGPNDAYLSPSDGDNDAEPHSRYFVDKFARRLYHELRRAKILTPKNFLIVASQGESPDNDLNAEFIVVDKYPFQTYGLFMSERAQETQAENQSRTGFH